MKRKIVTIGLAAMAFLLALLITVYPIISTRYNANHQSQIHTEYQQKIEAADNTELMKIREYAQAYNKALAPGVLADGGFSSDALLAASEDYARQLDPVGNGIMGYVSVPNLDITLPIYHGTSDATLEIGAGHLLGSSLPVGGDSTHTIITGHSGMASQKMFSDLDQMAEGDVFYLEVLGETLAYRVDQIKTVLPYDTSNLEIIKGKDCATLVTCTPFGVNTHRLLVRGERIPYEEAEELMAETQSTEEAESTWEEEYKKGILIGVTIVIVVILVAGIAWIMEQNANAGN